MKKLFLGLIRFYQKYLSLETGVIFPRTKVCRYSPTCSEYTYQAIEKYGILHGSWLGLKRLSRCHPFEKSGLDPLT